MVYADSEPAFKDLPPPEAEDVITADHLAQASDQLCNKPHVAQDFLTLYNCAMVEDRIVASTSNATEGFSYLFHDWRLVSAERLSELQTEEWVQQVWRRTEYPYALQGRWVEIKKWTDVERYLELRPGVLLRSGLIKMLGARAARLKQAERPFFVHGELSQGLAVLAKLAGMEPEHVGSYPEPVNEQFIPWASLESIVKTSQLSGSTQKALFCELWRRVLNQAADTHVKDDTEVLIEGPIRIESLDPAQFPESYFCSGVAVNSLVGLFKDRQLSHITKEAKAEFLSRISSAATGGDRGGAEKEVSSCRCQSSRPFLKSELVDGGGDDAPEVSVLG